MKSLRAITMCTAFNTKCGSDNSTNNFIGGVYCPETKCSGKPSSHKKTFQSLGRIDYQGLQCSSVCQVRNIPFEDQTKSFFCSFGQRDCIFEETPNSLEGVIRYVSISDKYCLNKEKCESLDGYVTTQRSIPGCDKRGAWLFLHKVPFALQEHVKTTITHKTRFFFAGKKRWTCYPTNNC